VVSYSARMLIGCKGTKPDEFCRQPNYACPGALEKRSAAGQDGCIRDTYARSVASFCYVVVSDFVFIDKNKFQF
jgi:hypothetical protein